MSEKKHLNFDGYHVEWHGCLSNAHKQEANIHVRHKQNESQACVQLEAPESCIICSFQYQLQGQRHEGTCLDHGKIQAFLEFEET